MFQVGPSHRERNRYEMHQRKMINRNRFSTFWVAFRYAYAQTAELYLIPLCRNDMIAYFAFFLLIDATLVVCRIAVWYYRMLDVEEERRRQLLTVRRFRLVSQTMTWKIGFILSCLRSSILQTWFGDRTSRGGCNREGSVGSRWGTVGTLFAIGVKLEREVVQSVCCCWQVCPNCCIGPYKDKAGVNGSRVEGQLSLLLRSLRRRILEDE